MRLVVDTNVFVSDALEENSLPFPAGSTDITVCSIGRNRAAALGRPAPVLHRSGDDLSLRRSGADAGGARAVATSHLRHPDTSHKPRS